ncbi:MAG: hypothetical protein AB7J30_20505, partial [Hyphomicrobium sp.]|uniref:hypothetical protein n=1 Tax=Hyphomicrobium sp. TaxID=82 RepID=UPI003D1511A9
MGHNKGSRDGYKAAPADTGPLGVHASAPSTVTEGYAPPRADGGRPPAQVPLDDGEAFSHQLLSAMMAFRSGDFTVRLPADLTGIHGKIADAFNDVLAVSERRALEAARVCRVVGKEGKLKQRMNVPGVTGG